MQWQKITIIWLCYYKIFILFNIYIWKLSSFYADSTGNILFIYTVLNKYQPKWPRAIFFAVWFIGIQMKSKLWLVFINIVWQQNIRLIEDVLYMQLRVVSGGIFILKDSSLVGEEEAQTLNTYYWCLLDSQENKVNVSRLFVDMYLLNTLLHDKHHAYQRGKSCETGLRKLSAEKPMIAGLVVDPSLKVVCDKMHKLCWMTFTFCTLRTDRLRILCCHLY